MAFSHVLKVYDEYGHQIPIMGIRGATGAKIISTQFIGEDEYGNYQYLQTFDNGHRNVFTAPRGETEKVLMGERIKKKPSQRELTVAVQLLWQKLGGLVVCLLVCLQASAVVTRDTEWRDVPPETLIKDVVDLSATGGGVAVTNAVNGITTNGAPVVLDATRIAHITFPSAKTSAPTNVLIRPSGAFVDDGLISMSSPSNSYYNGLICDGDVLYFKESDVGFTHQKTGGVSMLGLISDTTGGNFLFINSDNQGILNLDGSDIATSNMVEYVVGLATNSLSGMKADAITTFDYYCGTNKFTATDSTTYKGNVAGVTEGQCTLKFLTATTARLLAPYRDGSSVVIITAGNGTIDTTTGKITITCTGVFSSLGTVIFTKKIIGIPSTAQKAYADENGNRITSNYLTHSATNGLASTNYVNEYVAEYVNTDVCWSKPNLWCLEVELGYTATVAGDVTTVTNGYGAIWETKSVTYAFGNYADLYPEVYDEYSFEPVVIASYRCLTPGGTISASGRLTTVSNATYLCAARDTKGVESTISVPIQSSLQTISDVSVYKADLAGSARKAVNDAAKTLMTSPTSGGTGTYEGITYNIWNHFTQPAWALTQAGAVGCVKAFALGTTVMASAAHYSWHAQGQQTVGSTTVTKGQAERLYDWAMTNGWNKAQLDEMNIRDIEVIPLTAGTIPLNDLPYLMTEAQLNATYGGSLEGIQCWTATQSFQAPLTRVFKNYYGKYGNVWSNYSELGRTGEKLSWRDDLTALITALGTTYPVHSGDSGHPIYFKDAAGRFVLTSHFYSAGGGPNYIKGYPVIKAYVEAHGGQIRSIP